MSYSSHASIKAVLTRLSHVPATRLAHGIVIASMLLTAVGPVTPAVAGNTPDLASALVGPTGTRPPVQLRIPQPQR